MDIESAVRRATPLKVCCTCIYGRSRGRGEGNRGKKECNGATSEHSIGVLVKGCFIWVQARTKETNSAFTLERRVYCLIIVRVANFAELEILLVSFIVAT